MNNLSQRQTIIKEKKMQNSFRDFIRDIASRYPLVIYKQQWMLSLYPEHERSCKVISHQDFESSIPDLVSQGLDYDHQLWFFENFQKLFHHVPFFCFVQL